MSTSTLTSLAILKVNWDHLGTDYVENFVPFVVESARESHEEVISLPDMQKTLAESFGLTLPQNAIRMIISRATKRGYFRRESGVIYKNKEKCDELDFRIARDAVDATYDRVVSAVQAYAESFHKKSWSPEEADRALTDFLADSSLSLLFDAAEGRRDTPESEGAQFIVASFVQHAETSDQSLMDDLVMLARGNLLVNAMYLPEQGKISKRFKRTNVYFDTSFIMYATGFAGPDRAAPCLELLDLLREYGAELRCLAATRNELQGVLDACAARLREGRTRDAYGPTIEYFVETGKSSSDLELMSARLPGKLRAMGIKVVDPPSYDDSDFQIDEKGFDEVLEQNINYGNPNARIHDVDCISAMARLRRGRESRDAEECVALFVTTNTALARSAREFFQADAAPGSIALAVTDYALANLLWLKNPTAAPELPRKILLADSYAAMQPPPMLWKKYLTEIARLEDGGGVSADEYMLLRHSLSAKAALMDLTDGRQDAFTEGTVKDILDVAKENVRADLRRDLESQRQRRLEAEERLQEARHLATAQKVRLRGIATRIGRAIRHLLFGLAFVLLVIGLVVTFPTELPALPGRYIQPGILVLVALLTIGNLVWGATLRQVLDWIENQISLGIERALFAVAGIPQERSQAQSETE